jgi:hypothetical protein
MTTLSISSVCGNMSTPLKYTGTKGSFSNRLVTGLHSGSVSITSDLGLQLTYTTDFTKGQLRSALVTSVCSPARGGSTTAMIGPCCRFAFNRMSVKKGKKSTLTNLFEFSWKHFLGRRGDERNVRQIVQLRILIGSLNSAWFNVYCKTSQQRNMETNSPLTNSNNTSNSVSAQLLSNVKANGSNSTTNVENSNWPVITTKSLCFLVHRITNHVIQFDNANRVCLFRDETTLSSNKKKKKGKKKKKKKIHLKKGSRRNSVNDVSEMLCQEAISVQILNRPSVGLPAV